MPPPNKRAFASRRSAAVYAVKRKRRDSTGEREVLDGGPSVSDSEDSDSTMDSNGNNNGLTEEQRIYAEEVYKSHRREYRQVCVWLNVECYAVLVG